jgi:hypothetical protein
MHELAKTEVLRSQTVTGGRPRAGGAAGHPGGACNTRTHHRVRRAPLWKFDGRRG